MILSVFSSVRIKLLALDAAVERIYTEGRLVVLVCAKEEKLDQASLQRRFGSSIKAGATRVKLDTKQLGKHWVKILEEVLKAMGNAERSGPNPR